jgi:hypothetical protein
MSALYDHFDIKLLSELQITENIDSYSKKDDYEITSCKFRLDIDFEVSGWDVFMRHGSYFHVYKSTLKTENDWKGDEYMVENKVEVFSHGDNNNILIEIKPNLSDDYPDVLRQIKSRYNTLTPKRRFYSQERLHSGIVCLLIGSFQTESVTLDQVKEIFKRSGIIILMDHEVPNIKIPKQYNV